MAPERQAIPDTEATARQEQQRKLDAEVTHIHAEYSRRIASLEEDCRQLRAAQTATEKLTAVALAGDMVFLAQSIAGVHNVEDLVLQLDMSGVGTDTFLRETIRLKRYRLLVAHPSTQERFRTMSWSRLLKHLIDVDPDRFDTPSFKGTFQLIQTFCRLELPCAAFAASLGARRQSYNF